MGEENSPPVGGNRKFYWGELFYRVNVGEGIFLGGGMSKFLAGGGTPPPSPSSRENLDRGKFTAYSLLDNSTARWISKISDTNCS